MSTHLTPVTDALTLLYHLWGLPAPTLHDPMAIALYLDPSLCETKRLAVEVDAKGFTRVAEGKPANATVALNVDREKFFQFYLSRVAP
ncbi:MAG: nucleoside hydrolase [Acidobacteriia bacterium]|nr:nucleoside hydrolase [Terriglobia bacterium]